MLISEDQIFSRIDEMAEAASKRYRQDKPIFVRVRNGADEFADRFEEAARVYGLEFETGTITVKSMEGTETTGVHVVTEEYSGPDMKDRKVVLLEDIIDTGKTVEFLLGHLAQFAPSIIKTIALFAKMERREVPVELEDTGFDIAGFVVGFHTDWDDHYRELRDLWVVKFPPHTVVEYLKNFFDNLIPKKAKRKVSPTY